MSKAVILSIRPEYCELIARGKKTVEVRKTRPKLETPFKCYIYCAKDKHGWFDFSKKVRLDGKVIGEFVCRRRSYYPYLDDMPVEGYFLHSDDLEASCLSYKEIETYGNGKNLHFMHISDLVIYDKPKELSEFRLYDCGVKIEDGYPMPTQEIKRPPQSWCYVEELEVLK